MKPKSWVNRGAVSWSLLVTAALCWVVPERDVSRPNYEFVPEAQMAYSAGLRFVRTQSQLCGRFDAALASGRARSRAANCRCTINPRSEDARAGRPGTDRIRSQDRRCRRGWSAEPPCSPTSARSVMGRSVWAMARSRRAAFPRRRRCWRTEPSR